MEHDQGRGVSGFEKVRVGLRVNGWGLWMLGLGLWSRVWNRLRLRLRLRVGVRVKDRMGIKLWMTIMLLG